MGCETVMTQVVGVVKSHFHVPPVQSTIEVINPWIRSSFPYPIRSLVSFNIQKSTKPNLTSVQFVRAVALHKTMGNQSNTTVVPPWGYQYFDNQSNITIIYLSQILLLISAYSLRTSLIVYLTLTIFSCSGGFYWE